MTVRDLQQLDTIGSAEYENLRAVLPVRNVEVPLGN